MANAILVDRRNFDQIAPQIIQQVQAASLTGFDLETEDDKRHDGLNAFMNVDPITRKKASNKKLVFDTRRTTICGFSLYPDGSDAAYYVNLNHADAHNRVPWNEARVLLDNVKGYFVAHNAPFELTMMKACYDYDIEKIICTLQMAVSAYGPDEYDINSFVAVGLGGIRKLIPRAARAFATYDPTIKKDMTPEQAEVFAQVVAKESDADHSYNGLIGSIAFPYGLKEAVARWFGVQMRTFEETLNGKAHMGQLTGEETVYYGADDSYWAVQLYHKLLQYMLSSNPDVVETFFKQELPMVHVYSDVWRVGMKVNRQAIEDRRQFEREECVRVLRRMRKAVSQLLPFPTEPNAKLIDHEKWYASNHSKYRKAITEWAYMADAFDPFMEVHRIAGAVSEAWARDKGKPKSTGPNFTHYMPVRVLLYDLLGEKPIIEKGKIQSDAEARGKIQDRLKKRLKEEGENPRLAAGIEVIDCLTALAGIEQRMKLYLTPYTQLTDPETNRMYPVLSSKLATRRMATSFPNPMQLAKRGESTYVRGFYLPDEEDHVILSIDWSSVELVLIGDASGDPEFKKVFGQIPYGDLHSGAAADILSVEVEGLTEDFFKSIKNMTDISSLHPRLVTNLKGELMDDGGKIVKYWRTEVGKGANFNFWYSGSLSTVGQRMGWTPDQMWAATERYRNRFAVAEQWRVALIEEGHRNGYITLPDGHRRVRFECTPMWQEIMWNKFGQYNDPGINAFAREVIKAVGTRAKNQLVNSRIQGTCATLAKRSILRIRDRIKQDGFRARFMLPIHDELLFSVHKDEVADFMPMAKKIMCDHPDIVPNLPLDASAAIGLTFEPFNAKKAPIGQIELDEAPSVEWLPKAVHGKKLDRAGINTVIDYLFDQRSVLAKAA